MRQQESRVNSVELTIIGMIPLELNSLLRVSKHLYHNTSGDSIIGTSLATYLRQTHSDRKGKLHFRWNQDSLLWDNGRLIGAKAITFQPDSIC